MKTKPRKPAKSSGVSRGNPTGRSIGLQFISSIVAEKAAPLVRSIDPELLFEEGPERRAFYYIRKHFRENQVIPTYETVADNTGIVLPEVAEPASYLHTRCRQRAMHTSIMEPYNRLQEALQNPRKSMQEMDDAITDMYRMKLRFLESPSGVEGADEALHEIVRQHNEQRMLGATLRGIPTGFSEVDQLMDGYNPGDLVVWVGRPGRSKSWFLLKQAYAAWSAGYMPLYVSMEMGSIQNFRRLLGIHSGINPTFMKRGRIQTLSMPHFQQSVNELLALKPFHMVTANFSRTVAQIANYIEEHKPHIVFIDAGYLLSPTKKRYGSSGRRETISDVIEELKELGANAGIPIVITVQFNREADKRRRSDSGGFNPIAHLSLTEIGETDVIGQTASHVFGIEYPPKPLAQDSHRVFGFLKGREGENGWWLTRFMETQHSPIDISSIPKTDPIYEQLAEYARSQQSNRRGSGGNPRNTQAGQRTRLMELNQ